jgi:hypothetical protein
MYTQIKRLRTAVLVFLTHHLALPFLRQIRKPRPFPYTEAELAAFPPGTLGRDLVTLLQEKQLPLLTHYARHDLKHILLGYDTTEEGEVCLQSFMLGNGRISFPVIATVLYGFFTMPEYWSLFLQHYRKGRRLAPIHNWPWFSLLQEPTQALQYRIFNTPKIKWT